MQLKERNIWFTCGGFIYFEENKNNPKISFKSFCTFQGGLECSYCQISFSQVVLNIREIQMLSYANIIIYNILTILKKSIINWTIMIINFIFISE